MLVVRTSGLARQRKYHESKRRRFRYCGKWSCQERVRSVFAVKVIANNLTCVISPEELRRSCARVGNRTENTVLIQIVCASCTGFKISGDLAQVVTSSRCRSGKCVRRIDLCEDPVAVRECVLFPCAVDIGSDDLTGILDACGLQCCKAGNTDRRRMLWQRSVCLLQTARLQNSLFWGVRVILVLPRNR